MTLDREVPHYSLRKLGIGVVSVLLGTTMYLGANSTVAKAATAANSNATGSDAVQADAASKTGALQSASTVTMANTPATSATAATSVAPTQNSGAQNVAASEANETVSSQATVESNSQSENANASTSTATQAMANSNANTQSFTVSTANGSENNAASLTESKVQQDATTINIGKSASLSTTTTTLEGYANGKAVMNFKAVANPGDVYTIKVPKKYVDMASKDVAQIQGAIGNTTFNDDDKDYYVITDTFAKSATITQDINLNASSTYLGKCSPDTVYPGERFKMAVTLEHNGETKKLPLEYQLPSKFGGSLSYGLQRDLDDNNSRFKLNGEVAIRSGQSLPYVVRFLEYGIDGGYYVSAINHGATVRIPVPKYFKLDTTIPLYCLDTTQSHLMNLDDLSKFKISQAGIGQDVLLTIPAGSKIFDKSQFSEGNSVVFHGIMQVPDSVLLGKKTAFSAKGNPTVTQEFNDGKQTTITADKNYTYYVLPAVKNISDGYIFGISQVKSGNHVGGTYDDGTVADANYNIMQDSAGNRYTGWDTATFGVTNITNEAQKNTVIHINYPDGLNVYNLDVRAIGNDTQCKYSAVITYRDGTKENISDITNQYGYNKQENKIIKNVDITVSNFLPGAFVQVAPSTNYKIAANYSNGKLVTAGDNLRTTININDDQNKITQVDMIFPKEVIPLTIRGNVLTNQLKTNPGAQAAGFIEISFDQANTSTDIDLVRPIVYIKLPNNAVPKLDNASFKIFDINDIVPTTIYTPKSLSTFTVGKDKFLKIDLSNYDNIPNGINIYGYLPSIKSLGLPVSNKFDAQSSTEPIGAFILTQNAKDFTGYSAKESNLANLDKNVDQSKWGNEIIQHDGIDPTLVFASLDEPKWQILTPTATVPAEAAQGNQDSGLVLQGSSEDHQGSKMNYATSFVNGTNTTLYNVESFTNLPQKDGNKGFNVTLTGPAQVINAMTGEQIKDATIKYSTQPVAIAESQKPSQDGFVSADQLNGNWSAVRSVLVTMPSVSGKTSVRIVFPGEDKTIYDDVNQTAYLASSTWASGRNSSEKQKPFIISAGGNGSSSVTVKEQDKINVEIHYTDKNGKDVYVKLPDKAKVYNYGDTMKQTDFLNSDSDLTAADKALLPSPIYINYAHPTIENSNENYGPNYKNGTAEFGQKVKYDFNNDTVVYEASLNNTTPTKRTTTVTEVIKYQYANGDPIPGDKYKDHVVTVKVTQTGIHHGDTNTDDWNGKINSAQFDAVTSPELENYTPDQAVVNGQVVQLTNENWGPQTITKIVKYSANTSTVYRHKVINETIKYVYSNGKTAAPTVTKKVTLTQTGTKNLATNTTDWNGQWNNPATFEAVKSPTISGYTPDKQQIDSRTVQVTNDNYGDNFDKTFTVTYKADQQKITVNYIDDTTKTTLSSKSLTGDSGADAIIISKSITS